MALAEKGRALTTGVARWAHNMPSVMSSTNSEGKRLPYLAVFPMMPVSNDAWGEPRSPGHSLDLASTIAGVAMLLVAVIVRVERRRGSSLSSSDRLR